MAEPAFIESRVDIGLDQLVLVQYRYKPFRQPNRSNVEVRFFTDEGLPIGFVEYVDGSLWAVNTGYFKPTEEDVTEYQVGQNYPRNSAQRLNILLSTT